MSSGHQRITWHRNIAENFNRLSRVHERYRQTDRRQTDRQTTDGRTTTYSEHEHEFTFAKNRDSAYADNWGCTGNQSNQRNTHSAITRKEMMLASLALDLLLLARRNSEVATVVRQSFHGQSVVALVMLLEGVKCVILTSDLSEEV